jgi:hypothetical protein
MIIGGEDATIDDEDAFIRDEDAFIGDEDATAAGGRGIPDRVGTCHDGKPAPGAVEIVEQRLRGGIAAGGLLLQGLENDGVEVAPKQPPQPVRSLQHSAGRLGFGGADDALDLGRGLALELWTRQPVRSS